MYAFNLAAFLLHFIHFLTAHSFFKIQYCCVLNAYCLFTEIHLMAHGVYEILTLVLCLLLRMTWNCIIQENSSVTAARKTKQHCSFLVYKNIIILLLAYGTLNVKLLNHRSWSDMQQNWITESLFQLIFILYFSPKSQRYKLTPSNN